MCDRYDCLAKEEKENHVTGKTIKKEPPGRHPIKVSRRRATSLGRGMEDITYYLCDECFEDYEKTGRTPPFKPKPTRSQGPVMGIFRNRRNQRN